MPMYASSSNSSKGRVTSANAPVGARSNFETICRRGSMPAGRSSSAVAAVMGDQSETQVVNRMARHSSACLEHKHSSLRGSEPSHRRQLPAARGRLQTHWALRHPPP